MLPDFYHMLLQMKWCFPWGRKWITFCGWQSWKSTPRFDASFNQV